MRTGSRKHAEFLTFTGSRTPEPQNLRNSAVPAVLEPVGTGSQPIRLEPEPVSVMTDEKMPTGSRTAKGAEGSHSRGSGSLAVVSPRLLSLRQMADYLGCSYWSARDWVLAGLVPVVELPPLRAREGEPQRTRLRRVLVDVRDLDVFIEARKGGRSPDVQARAPQIEAGKTGRNRATVPALCPLEAAQKPETRP